jgi:DNA-binding beta-propeller fold protein YncE
MFTESANAAPMIAVKKRKAHAMERVIKMSLTVAVLLIGLAVATLAYLVYPGTPGKSGVMDFEGFIELPGEGTLNVLDYLTLNDSALFVTNETSGAVFKVTLDRKTQFSSDNILQLPGAGSAHGVALVPEQNVGFVTRSEENTVDLFDLANLQPLGRIPVADDPDAIVYIPSAKLVYVAHGDTKMATLIDPEKRATVGTIQLPGKPEFPAFDSENGLLFQNLEDTNFVAAIDVRKGSVVGQWPLAPCQGPSGMAIDSDQRRLFAVCRGNARLVVFDLETHRVITSLKIGGGPDSVVFDAGLHRIYTAGKTGTMTVIQQNGPDTYRIMDEIHTHYGAHTLTADPVSHKVFVAYASLLTHPRIAVFSPTPSGRGE